MNIPDLTRYLKSNADEPNWLKRNWCSIWPQLLGIIPMMTLFAFIGAAAMLTSGQWDPIAYIASPGRPRLAVGPHPAPLRVRPMEHQHRFQHPASC